MKKGFFCKSERCRLTQDAVCHAFTLAEVLITIGILGVVAAITIPTLVKKYEERAFVVKLQQTYSILSEAHKLAVGEHGDPRFWNIGKSDTADGSSKLYNIYKPYFKRVKDCDTKKGCFADHYKALFNENWAWQPSSHPYYARGILLNGVSFIIWSNGTGCGSAGTSCGTLFVDLNGTQKPNQAGVDYFMFYIRSIEGIVPGGQIIKRSSSYGERCVYKDTSKYNGTFCTYWAISRGNMDYLRRDIDKEW